MNATRLIEDWRRQGRVLEVEGRHRFEATTGSALNNMRGWHGSKRLSPREALP